MEIYIVRGFRRLQSKHSTAQCNVQRRTCCRRRRKYWIETPTFMLIFSPFTLHRLYIIFFQIKSLYKCVIIECYVLHRSVSYWESLSCNFFSLFIAKAQVDWNSTLKREFQSCIFDDLCNKLVSAHCTVTSHVLTVTDENHKRCIFPILPVNVPLSYWTFHNLKYLEMFFSWFVIL